MTRIDGKGPMNPSNNGDGTPQGIPEDIVWDEEDPPVIFACSQHTEHDSDCDGSCESEVTTENQVLLLNESKAWARANMNPDGIEAKSFHIQCQIQAIQQLLIGAGVFTKDEVDEQYAAIKYEIMHTTRMQLQDTIKEQQQRAALGLVPKPRLLGPHGEQLG